VPHALEPQSGGDAINALLASPPGGRGLNGALQQSEYNPLLALQIMMQETNLQQDAASNVLKTRHDTRKSPVSNFR
jgi:hypothetical protein